MASTPLGNLGDITLRTLEVLKACDVIACEDTRRSRILLDHHGISKRLLSCRAANQRQSAQGIVKLLAQGQMVVYLSDAGTPGLSDPGSLLVRAVREAGFPVRPLPGPSALTCLLSVCPYLGRGFTFDGFLPPRAAARRRRLQDLLNRAESFVFFEAPHRILQTLEDLAELAPERLLFLGREMTKKFEEYLSGTAADVLLELKKADKIRGEFTVWVSDPGQKIPSIPR